MLGTLVVLYMRQEVLNLRWWQAIAAAAVLSAIFARELALPANAFWHFFTRYTIVATAIVAVLARVLPPRLTSELPVRQRTFERSRRLQRITAPLTRSAPVGVTFRPSQEVLFRVGLLSRAPPVDKGKRAQ